MDVCKQQHLNLFSFQCVQHLSNVAPFFSSACVRWWSWRGNAQTEQWGSAQHWRANSSLGCPALTCGTRRSPSSLWRRPWSSTMATPNPPERPCGCSPHLLRTWHHCAASKMWTHTWRPEGLCLCLQTLNTAKKKLQMETLFRWTKDFKMFFFLFSVGCFHFTVK